MQCLQKHLKENALRGTPEFPVGFYTAVFPTHTGDMLIHWHEEIEFSLVRQGSISYEINQIPYELHKGDIILILPSTLHAAHHTSDAAAIIDSVVFHLDMAGLEKSDGCSTKFLQPIQSGSVEMFPVIHPEDKAYESFSSCFQELWACAEPLVPYRELIFKAQTMTLTRCIWEAASTQKLPAPGVNFRYYERKLHPALSYIEEHYPEPIRIGELAKLCGFSQVHFMNLFRAALGISCIEYVNSYRLSEAAVKLQKSEDPVSKIALDCGFSSISYFNRCFHKFYSMTPTAYRRRLL